jgi:GT2 family glycosyltransferase
MTRTALCILDDIDLSYRMLRKGKSNYYFSQTTVLHYKEESTIWDVYETLSGGHEFFYEKTFRLCLSIGMKMGTAFFIRKMFQGNLNLKVPQSLVFYSMIWNSLQKITSIFGKKFLFTI